MTPPVSTPFPLRSTALSAATGASASPFFEGDAGEEVPILLFRLGESHFGVPALAVREILALPALSALAETAPFVPGVLNLRGTIVPVMDLNARFERDSPRYRLEDSLIVLELEGAPVALLVSEVRAVSHIAAAQIEPPPAHGRASVLPAPFVAGVISTPEGIVMLLHLPHLLGWADGFNRSAPRLHFEAQGWTPAERATLQERALRLLTDAPGAPNGENALSTAIAPLEASRAQVSPLAVVSLGGEEFGVELSSIREFAAVSAVTGVPCCPPHILGQINLRGDIVTLIDARQALRTAQTEPPFFAPAQIPQLNAPFQANAPAKTVIVVSHQGSAVGIVVDDVRDVLYNRFDKAELADSSRVLPQSYATGSYFTGSAPYRGRLLPLLDVTRLLDEGGLEVEENA